MLKIMNTQTLDVVKFLAYRISSRILCNAMQFGPKLYFQLYFLVMQHQAYRIPCYSDLHSFNKYLTNVYFEPGTVLNLGDILINMSL